MKMSSPERRRFEGCSVAQHRPKDVDPSTGESDEWNYPEVTDNFFLRHRNLLVSWFWSFTMRLVVWARQTDSSLVLWLRQDRSEALVVAP
jgi:hypothetical protein